MMHTNIQHLHDETLILPSTSTCSPTPHNSNIQHTPTQTHTILHHSKAKISTIFNNARYTRNILTDRYTVTTTDSKANMRHIYISIVSRHLPTRGNHKIMRTPPLYTRISDETLPRHTGRTIAQLRTHKSPILKSYLHKYDANSHQPPPFITLTHTTHIISSTAPPYALRCHPWTYGQTPPK